jgi:glycosyltransferase involved in cell wall biosynthesis
VIRVAQVITSVVLGGGGQVMSSFARQLDTKSFAMDFFCVLEGGELVDYIRSLGFRVEIIPVCKERGALRYDARNWARLGKELRQGSYDVVHTHHFRADLVGSVAARAIGRAALVRTLHNMGTRKTAYQVWLDRFLNRAAYQKIVCVSEIQGSRALARDAIRREQLEIIHNGVDADRLRSGERRPDLAASIGLDPSRTVVGTVGRLVEEKGHRLLVQSIPEIMRRIPDVQFLVVGDGPLRASVERMAAEAGADLVVTGLRQDVPQLLKIMDVFVFPSWSEAFGIAVIEAMAAGVPVVCSAIPALMEIVEDNQSGLLFQSGSAEALAEHVCRVLQDPCLAKRLSNAGDAVVRDRFTESRMIRCYEDLYRSLS